jgi:hypothetical protein
MLALYVDNCNLAGLGGTFIVNFKREFGLRLNVHDLGLVSWLMGMTVERGRAARVIKLGHRQYILDIMEKFNISEAMPMSTPMALGSMVESADESGSAASLPYQSLISSLKLKLSTTIPANWTGCCVSGLST